MEDFPWAFAPVGVDEPAEHSLALGYEQPDEASSGTGRVFDFVIERERACSVRRVADSEAVDNSALENIPSVGDTVGHIPLVHAQIAVDTHLDLHPVPCRDFQDRYGQNAKIHGDYDLVVVQAQEGPVVYLVVSSVADQLSVSGGGVKTPTHISLFSSQASEAERIALALEAGWRSTPARRWLRNW